jgi:hypothetical protein
MIYKYSENGFDGVILFAEDDGVRIGVTHLDKISTCLLSKTAARAMAKRMSEGWESIGHISRDGLRMEVLFMDVQK